MRPDLSLYASKWYIFTRHLLFAAFLTMIGKFTGFSFVKKERRVNAYKQKCFSLRLTPNSGFCEMVSATKIKTIFDTS